MSTPTAEAIAGMLPVYIPKTDPEEAARRKEVRDRAAVALAELLRPSEDGSLWDERGTGEEVKDARFFGTLWWPCVRACIVERDGGRCTMCGAEWPLEVHHVLPRHLGGADSPRNLRTLCRRCHDMAHRSGAAERAMADEHQARLEVWG